ncbi:MAG: hypothetical protein KDA37_01185 [Planctomycetales bacterium]|nr:hypothetical protein [Planctomycetales bacterium]
MSVHAGTGIFGTYLFLDIDGSPITYGLSETGGASTPDFQGVDLGDFNPISMSLTLDGAQANTFKNGSGDVTGADLFYTVYPTGGPQGSFTQVSLSFAANSPYTDAGGVSIGGGGDQKWETTNANIDLLASLAPGDYNLEVYIRASTNEGDRYHNAGGANYIGSFSISSIPELSSFVGMGLVSAVFGGMSLRRRQRRARSA